MSETLDWTILDRIGQALGVNRSARQKWRQRQHIPHKYRLPIISATGGVISAHDFEAMDRKREQNRSKSSKSR